MKPISAILKSDVRELLRRRPNAAKDAGRKKPLPDANVRGRYGIVISVDAGGWRLAVHLAGGGEISRESRGGPDMIGAGRAGQNLLQAIQHAVGDLSGEERGGIAWVELRISDPQIEVLDNRLIKSGMNDRESAALLSRQVLGRDESAFDVCAFGLQADGEVDRKVIAAVPLERIREYLASLGDLAVKVRAIVPEAVSILAEADNSSEATVGAIEFGASHTQILLAESHSGAVVQRVIPLGVRQFAEKLAEAQSLPIEEAAEALRARNFIARLSSERISGQNRRELGASDRALAAVAMALRDDIRRTIVDFTENRLAEAPVALAATGCPGEVNGLLGWLSDQVEVALEPRDSAGNGDVMAPRPLNLLRGTNDPLIVLGRTRYRFRDERFMPDDSDRDAQPETAVSVADRNGGGSARGRGRRRGQEKSKASDAQRNRRALAIAAAGGAVFAAMMLFDHVIAPVRLETQRAVDALTAASDRTSALRGQLAELTDTYADQVRSAQRSRNKILWTEKFLSISRALPPGVWLTEAMIIHDERQVGKAEVITTKMLIRGRTTLDDRRHLTEIANFIQGLENDPQFMSDFRQITFEGLDRNETGDVGFEIHAWYDENKRKTAADEAGEGDSGGAIDGLRRKTDRRQQMQEKLINLGPAGRAGSS